MPIVFPSKNQDEGREFTEITQYLLCNRVVLIGEYINENVANRVIVSLLALELFEERSEITLYINSTGASTSAAIAIVDIMMQLNSPINTVAMGIVYSASALVLAAGTKGMRY